MIESGLIRLSWTMANGFSASADPSAKSDSPLNQAGAESEARTFVSVFLVRILRGREEVGAA